MTSFQCSGLATLPADFAVGVAPIGDMANIIQVAHADVKLTGTEQALIETVRKEPGIKKGDLSADQKMVDNGSYVMKPVGTFST